MPYILLAIKSTIIGVANIVPGVSGATLAVMLKLYSRLIDAINSLFTNTKESLKFLIPFGLGMVVGIIAFGSLIDILLTHFSLPAGALITGLMAGSLPYVCHMANTDTKHKPHHYITTAICAGIIITVVLLVPSTESYAQAQFTAILYVRLFAAGLLGAAAMVVPGVSGSVVLILFGVFGTAMHTITLIREYLATPLDFALLLPILQVVMPVGIGMVIGIIATSKLIALLLKKYTSITYCAILGFVLATIFAIFSDDATYQSHANITLPLVVASICIFAIGCFAAVKLGTRHG